MYYRGQDGYREGGSPLSSVPPTRYIPELGVEKAGANRIADMICPVRPGSRPNCAGSCNGGRTNEVKMGTRRVVPPSHRCPPPDTSQDWGSIKGERTESPTRYVPCARGRAPTVQDHHGPPSLAWRTPPTYWPLTCRTCQNAMAKMPK